MAETQIKADKDGFIIGDNVVELQLSDMARLLAVMRQVKSDTGEILKQLDGIGTMAVAIAAKPYSRAANVANQNANAVSRNQSSSPERQYVARSPANDAVMPLAANKEQGELQASSITTARSASSIVAEQAKSKASANPEEAPIAAEVSAKPQRINTNRKAAQNGEKAAPERGANGRFLKRESTGEDGSAETLGSGFAAKIGESITDNLNGFTDGTEEVDPAIKATQEVAEILSPIASITTGIGGAAVSGVQSLFGGGDAPAAKAEKAPSRFMSLFNRRAARNEEAANKEQSGLLKDISVNIQKLVKKDTGAGGGDGLLGSLIRGGGSLVGGLMSKVGGVLSMLGAGAAGLLGAKVIKDAIKKPGSPDKTKGVPVPVDAKKVPVTDKPASKVDVPDQGSSKAKMIEAVRSLPVTKMLAPIAAALSTYAIYQTAKAPDNPLLSAEQNRANKFKDVGGIAGGGIIGTAGFAGGMASGAAIGTLILPGVGTAIGGIIGGLAGGALLTDIGEKIGQFIGVELSKIDWSGIYKTLSESISNITEDIKAKASALWAATTAKVSSVVTVVKETTSSAATSAKVYANTAIDTARTAKNKALDYVGLGSLSAQYEGKSHTVAKDNNGSYAYGKYQFNAKAGGVEAFFKANPEYRAKFAGLQPNTPEFNKRWKEIAASDTSFEAAQDKAAKQQFFDPLAPLAKSSGFKMNDRGVQEALFSGAVNHSAKGNRAIYAAASSAPGFADMSPQEQIDAFYKARTEYVQKANIAGGQAVKNSLSQRYVNERMGALGLAGKTAVSDQPNSPLAPVSNSANAVQVKVPFAPRAAAVKTNAVGSGVLAPVEPVKQLNQPQAGKETVIAVIDQPVGQDITDRRIASLVTGGLSG